MRIVLFFLCISLISCRQNAEQLKTYQFRGETMGTYYNVKFLYKHTFSQKHIDNTLEDLNANFSTYIDNSQISIVNNSYRYSTALKKEYADDFNTVFSIAKKIYKESEGKFDPTVKPLVDYWGFGKEKTPRKFKTEEIDSIKALVGFDKLSLETKESQTFLKKANPNIEIDFSAIAKGYAVDKLSLQLEEKGIVNYMVEIGGETRCAGKNERGLNWTVGISEPKADASPLKAIIKIQPLNMSIASSGNYRNFYTIEGKTVNHTIDPNSGMAFPSDLLAVSIIAADCTTADAIATACMAMGLKSAQNFIAKTNNVEACFFYEKDGEIIPVYSASFEQYIVN